MDLGTFVFGVLSVCGRGGVALTKQRTINEGIVREIQEKLENATSVVITDYRGLTVAQATELRRQLREAGVEFQVLKNTLTILAARGAGIEGLEDVLKGPSALAFSGDPVSAAKVLYRYAKKNEALEVKGGVLEGRSVTVEEIRVLAELPSREELLAKLAGGMASPLVGFAAVLQAPIRELAGVLDAVRVQKEQAA